MAGHSKWANIQHRKRAQDSKRAKIFTKLIREITVAARMGGGIIESNPRLRAAVAKGLDAGMTRDTIDRAIKRGVGDTDSDNFVAVTYEGYGPGGVAVLVECLTDNRNRTVSEVRHAFSKCGGNLGTDGSVAYLFRQQGQIIFSPEISEEKVMEVALEAGAEDVFIQADQSIEVITTLESFEPVRQAFEKEGLKSQQADISPVASISVNLSDKESAEKMVRLLDMLEDLDDVQQVYSNADIPESLLSEIN